MNRRPLTVELLQDARPGSLPAEHFGQKGAGSLVAKVDMSWTTFYFRYFNPPGRRRFLAIGLQDEAGESGIPLELARQRAKELAALRPKYPDLHLLVQIQFPTPPAPKITVTRNGVGVPEESGVYFVWKGARIVDVGQAGNFHKRCRSSTHPRMHEGEGLSWVIVRGGKRRREIAEGYYRAAYNAVRAYDDCPLPSSATSTQIERQGKLQLF